MSRRQDLGHARLSPKIAFIGMSFHMRKHDGTHCLQGWWRYWRSVSESFSSYPIDFNVPDIDIPPYLRRHHASTYQRIHDARS